MKPPIFDALGLQLSHLIFRLSSESKDTYTNTHIICKTENVKYVWLKKVFATKYIN